MGSFGGRNRFSDVGEHEIARKMAGEADSLRDFAQKRDEGGAK